MANILFDGCWGNQAGKWSSINVSPTANLGRWPNTPAYNGNMTLTKNLPTPQQTVIMGAAWMPLTTPAAKIPGETLWAATDTGLTQVQLSFDTLGRIVLWRGNTQVAWSAADTIPGVLQFRYLEIELKIDPVAGYCKIFLDEQLIPWVTGTDANTRNSANSQVTALGFIQTGNTSGQRVTDIYINTTTGPIAADNGRWGDVRVDPLAIGSVDVVQGTSSGGGASTIANLTDTNDATYNELANPGDKDQFNITNPGAANLTGIIRAVAVTPRWYKSDAGASTARVGLNSAGVDGNGATIALPSTVAEGQQQFFPTDPATGAGWAAGAFAALKAFYQKVA